MCVYSTCAGLCVLTVKAAGFVKGVTSADSSSLRRVMNSNKNNSPRDGSWQNFCNLIVWSAWMQRRRVIPGERWRQFLYPDKRKLKWAEEENEKQDMNQWGQADVTRLLKSWHIFVINSPGRRPLSANERWPLISWTSAWLRHTFCGSIAALQDVNTFTPANNFSESCGALGRVKRHIVKPKKMWYFIRFRLHLTVAVEMEKGCEGREGGVTILESWTPHFLE